MERFITNCESKEKIRYGFIIMHGFMFKLGLDPGELILYAVIYSFTHGKEKMFYGSRKYLAELLSCSERSVYRTLKSLIDKGYVKRHENNRNALITTDAQEIRRNDGESLPTAEKIESAPPKKAERTMPDEEICESPRPIIQHSKCDFYESCNCEDDGECEDDDMTLKFWKYRLPAVPPKPKYAPQGYGRNGLVKMTREQYLKLVSLVTPETLYTYISKLEGYIENGNPRPHSCYKTLKKWITEDFSS